ncbi:MAG: hypothetical protein RMH93_06900 [Aquificaceae bacterium]|nr:hypothetical protein [Aquificaceae bacterium]MCS7195668.1 hypothetical protein [Aquificaceae bacterium]MDW8033259.1 hypothetical protein [Aquificaceae bacterium]MDW8295040.1 hypothetical protein [Aquificaceae bacterium]
MEELKERLKKIEELSLDPFRVEPLREELEELIKRVPQMSRQELEELRLFLQGLRSRLEENYSLCFGWIEEAFRKGFRGQA